MSKARPSAITAAMMPSIRSVDFFLRGLMLPAASIPAAMFDAIHRMTGLQPWRNLPEMTSFSNFLGWRGHVVVALPEHDHFKMVALQLRHKP